MSRSILKTLLFIILSARKLCIVVDRSCWRKRTQRKQQTYRRGNVCNANDYEDEMERELECCGLYRPTRDSDWVDAMPMPERIISLVRFLLLLFIE